MAETFLYAIPIKAPIFIPSLLFHYSIMSLFIHDAESPKNSNLIDLLFLQNIQIYRTYK